MMTSEPIYCRPEAYHLFVAQMPRIDTSDGLLRAAVAVSMHALDDVDPDEVDSQLQALANRVLDRVRNRQVQALLAHLHDVLFEEEGFSGNADDYYNPLNSYVPMVMESHQGIPITLGLIYKIVAERIGLGVVGVNSPGHFLLRVRDESQWMLIDPYHGGDVLSQEEAFLRVEEATGRTIRHHPRYLPTATHTEWISRLLANLQHLFAAGHCRDDMAAMNELQSVVRHSLY